MMLLVTGWLRFNGLERRDKEETVKCGWQREEKKRAGRASTMKSTPFYIYSGRTTLDGLTAVETARVGDVMMLACRFFRCLPASRRATGTVMRLITVYPFFVSMQLASSRGRC